MDWMGCAREIGELKTVPELGFRNRIDVGYIH